MIILTLIFIELAEFPFVTSTQYKIKKILILSSLQCKGVKSDFLAKIAKYSVMDLDYLNLQLSYINNKGELSWCTAGWKGVPYLTSKINNKAVFNYASVTKVFTSELILDLVRQQRLNLDDKLIVLLPKLQHENLKDLRINEITLSNLLSHRAGFDSNLTPDTMVSVSPWCPYRLEVLTQLVLDFEPNTKKVYSNVGYCLLSQVIESYYSKSYIEVSQDYYKFNSSGVNFIKNNHTDYQNIPSINYDKILNSLDFFALSSVGGLSGTSTELSQYVHGMDRQTYPNITSRPENINCDIEKVRSCHGFSGYEYSSNESLTMYWRDGRLPKTSALVTMDSDKGVLAFLSSTENETTWITDHNKLVENIYDIYLKEKTLNKI